MLMHSQAFGLDALEIEVTPRAAHFATISVSREAGSTTTRPSSDSMSGQEANKPGGSSYFPPRGSNANSNNTLPPPGNRMRNPAPPSPLSRIQTETGGAGSASRSLPTPSSTTVPSGGGAHLVPQSPCFIHSHLDRTGTLQDWLQSRGAPQVPPKSNGAVPTRAANQHAQQAHVASSSRHPRIPSHQARHVALQTVPEPPSSEVSSAGSSRITSPIKREPSLSGYESDKSSAVGGSALLDGDFMDDEDDTGSLTRQLAETAQGVREMSKQLGTSSLF